METLDDVVCSIFPDVPAHLPGAEQSGGQRTVLMSHIAKAASQHGSRHSRTAFKVRVPLGIVLGLAFSGLGGGLGWAISGSSAPNLPPSASSPNTYTACAATTPTGSSANYIVAGDVCGPGHLPEVGFNKQSPPHTYCVLSGKALVPQNMILVLNLSSCPSGYVTTPPPASTT